MQAQMMEDMKRKQMAMAQYGGDNPWEVSYNKEAKDAIDASEAGSKLSDSATSGEGGMMDKAARSFSF